MCLGSLLCCVSSAACSCCCNTTTSSVTRISYILMWLTALLGAWIMTNENIGEQLQKIEKYSGSGSIIECEEYNNMTFFTNDTATCGERWSQLACYRIFFGTSMFFLIMMLITIGVKSTQDIRAGLQNSFWLVKIAGWIALIVAAFYISNDFFVGPWGYIGLVGAFFFMIVQGIILIGISHSWSYTFNTAEDGSSAKCIIPLITAVLDCAVISISVCLYVYYTYGDERGGCTTNKFLISFNLVMFFVMTVLGLVSPRNYDGEQGTVGIAPPALISFYTTYLTWSAVAETQSDCIPSAYDASDYLTTILGVVLAVFIVGALSNIKRKDAEEGTPEDVEGTTEDGKKVTIKMRKAQDNEANTVYYNWSMFHAAIALASLYTMNVLTNWATIRGRVSSAEIEIGDSDAPVWVQAVASWIVMVMFIFDIVIPILGPKCCPDRVWEHGTVTG
eukprot:m.22066 g.22066  ORF g.22066 m.22066 type:complete len:447 (-) comp13674_c0_seq1:329-1669(-)